jgi:glycosyltransferase involved in cell wall biosynthesis
VFTSQQLRRFLTQAVDSAVAGGAEVVVVDDGSTDQIVGYPPTLRWPDRCTSAGESRSTAAVNTGIAIATGDVVLLLDADDMVRSGFIGRVTDSFRAPDVQWLRHDMVLF